MPEIAVTQNQRERLRWIQTRLEEDVAYGHVRPCDALEYLLDYAEEHGGLNEISSEELESAEDPERERNAESAADAGATSHTASGGDDDDLGEHTDDAADAATDSDDTATLNSMMSLLDTHDEQWREAGGGEEKYEVDLPDGTTERARTKDDVRAVLFKHYR